MHKIANQLNIAIGSVYKHLKKNNIQTRTLKEVGYRVEKRKAINESGYKLIYVPNHTYANKQGYVRKHRLIYEKYLGRILEPYEIVHHIDGNKENNDISNLLLLTKSEHSKLHYKKRKIDKKGRIL